MSIDNKKVVSKLDELKLTAVPKLIVSKELKRQIDYLHKEVGSIEWSGVLYHKIIKGDTQHLDDLVIRCERLFLADVGTSAYTEYEVDENIIDFYSKFPETETMKPSHLHTHHSMSCFFSGTDQQELHDNAPSYNYYLSLIVNFKEEYCARIAFVCDYKSKTSTTGSLTFKDAKGEDTTVTLKNADDNISKQVLCFVDCKIEIEQEDDDLTKTINSTARQVFTTLEEFLSQSGQEDKIKVSLEQSIKKVINENLDIDTITLRVDDYTKERYEVIKEAKKPKYTSYSNTNSYSRNYNQSAGFRQGKDSLWDGDDYGYAYEGYGDYEDYGRKQTVKHTNLSGYRPARDLSKDTAKGIKLNVHELDNYLTKLLCLDTIREESLSFVLKTLDQHTLGKGIDFIIQQFKDEAPLVYTTCFTATPDDEDLDQCYIDCIGRLKVFAKEYSIVEDLIEMFISMLPKGRLGNSENFVEEQASKEKVNYKSKDKTQWQKLSRKERKEVAKLQKSL